MNQFEIKDDMIAVKGELCFGTLANLSCKPQALLANSTIHSIDLKEVTKCDTAGLALLLEWFCLAQKNGKQLKFLHPSQSILDFAAIHHLTQVLFNHAK